MVVKEQPRIHTHLNSVLLCSDCRMKNKPCPVCSEENPCIIYKYRHMIFGHSHRVPGGVDANKGGEE